MPLKNVFYLDDFTDGDGVKDNSKGFADCLAAARKDKRRMIDLGSAEYIINNSNLIDIPRFKLRGNNTAIKTSSEEKLLVVKNDFFKMEDIWFENTLEKATKGNALEIVTGFNTRIDGCTFFNFYDNINLIASSGLSMSHCYLYDAINYNLTVNATNADQGDQTLSDCRFYSNRKYQTEGQIFYKAGGGLKVNLCKFVSANASLPPKHILKAFIGSTVDFIFTDNSCEAYSEYGIYFQVRGGEQFSKLKINDNHFSSFASPLADIWIYGADTLTIEGNEFRDNGSANPVAIELQNCVIGKIANTYGAQYKPDSVKLTNCTSVVDKDKGTSTTVVTTGVTCGPGTHLVNGQCVPDVISNSCPIGQHWDGNKCVSDVVAQTNASNILSGEDFSKWSTYGVSFKNGAIIDSTETDYHYIYKKLSLAAGVYSASFLAKAGGRDSLLLDVTDDSDRAYALIDLKAGKAAVSGTGIFSNVSASVTAADNGYYKIDFSFTKSGDRPIRTAFLLLNESSIYKGSNANIYLKN